MPVEVTKFISGSYIPDVSDAEKKLEVFMKCVDSAVEKHHWGSRKKLRYKLTFRDREASWMLPHVISAYQQKGWSASVKYGSDGPCIVISPKNPPIMKEAILLIVSLIVPVLGVSRDSSDFLKTLIIILLMFSAWRFLSKISGFYE